MSEYTLFITFEKYGGPMLFFFIMTSVFGKLLLSNPPYITLLFFKLVNFTTYNTKDIYFTFTSFHEGFI